MIDDPKESDDLFRLLEKKMKDEECIDKYEVIVDKSGLRNISNELSESESIGKMLNFSDQGMAFAVPLVHKTHTISAKRSSKISDRIIFEEDNTDKENDEFFTKSQAMKVNQTLGGTLHNDEAEDGLRSPHRSLQAFSPKKHIEKSIRPSLAEPTEPMDPEGEAGEAAFSSDRVGKWVADERTLRLDKSVIHVPKLIRGNNNRGLCHICYRNGTRKLVHLKCVVCDEYLCDDACWSAWHSLQQLTGRDVVIRKGRRRR